ncbi:hypothetical protein BDN70DRAFT_940055 [Pholiota conissans]|uniref:Uncharacterized protein n=1 Tax=Pholiota conissans TaxID=109636 RepID=A0A9P5YJW7_9AGAR|nr:hypothetical protein BDN70DRAFT_940055 [Pholiota conissans]
MHVCSSNIFLKSDLIGIFPQILSSQTQSSDHLSSKIVSQHPPTAICPSVRPLRKDVSILRLFILEARLSQEHVSILQPSILQVRHISTFVDRHLFVDLHLFANLATSEARFRCPTIHPSILVARSTGEHSYDHLSSQLIELESTSPSFKVKPSTYIRRPPSVRQFVHLENTSSVFLRGHFHPFLKAHFSTSTDRHPFPRSSAWRARLHPSNTVLQSSSLPSEHLHQSDHLFSKLIYLESAPPSFNLLS